MRTWMIVGVLMLLGLAALAQPSTLYVGTYYEEGGKGIYSYRWNEGAAELTLTQHTDGKVLDPGFVTLSADGRYLYAGTDAKTEGASTVSAFRVQEDGSLQFINKVPSCGDNPVYVTVNKANTWLVAANYFGETVAAFPLRKNGGLKPYTQLLQFDGSSVNPDRQQGPHPHAAVFSPDEAQLFIPDLGTDRIMVYGFDATAKQPLTAAQPAFVSVASGSGPRHLAFHPNGRYAYLVCELSGTVEQFLYTDGELLHQKSFVVSKDDAAKPYGSADLLFSPDGRYLYVSNRGQLNNIVVFAVDAESGNLQIEQSVSCKGNGPRNIHLSADGSWLFVANRHSDNVVVFSRDKATGHLTYHSETAVPQPTCVTGS